ncbi:multidrug resistance protein, MATE family [Trypanosoma rangeli]|uniref:Multidrug resistance protein, MATE family n=1 Tax=Trypanosoma rangeli TaxID=5698 RepID=A0A422MXB7_TRYRA|nr:multidrug resistance protein, MATE family [Trypanosoma rangeli]RNE97894.1 multidrug resistance protein, MATE family [Trypanosoma rangeli]|eukprot:RNE97894.1 multidrug resistance protein, MATE family [Trypanosoma rangeli]
MYGEKTAEIACNFMKLGPLFIIPSVTFTACFKFALNHPKPQLPMTAVVVGFVVAPLAQCLLAQRAVRGAVLGNGCSGWGTACSTDCSDDALGIDPTDAG